MLITYARNHVTAMASERSEYPVCFIGHGSPMNAIEDNTFSRAWGDLGKKLPKPKAILCISAHWETMGARVTAMERPRTIHDFGGFPRELYAVRYPAPGSEWLARETKNVIGKTEVAFDESWGLDHGCWSVLKRMFPAADVPAVQLSLDYARSAQEHFELAKELAPQRKQGVLIIGSGNLVHNLGLVDFQDDDMACFNRPFGFDWAIEANELFKKYINENNHQALTNYNSLGKAVQLAIPTPEHYLPMLYALSLRQEGESLSYFNDQPVAGSLTMTSFTIGL